MLRKSKNGNGNGNGQGIHDVNVTPIIDVSLVLVIILLLFTPIAFESSIAVRRAMASAKAPVKDIKEERVEVTLVSEDTVRVNRRLVARAELSETLAPLLANTAERRVIVECNDRVSHGAFVNVLDQAKLCGAGDIAVLGR
jgi:biopolymer transport protein ExbD